MKILIISDAWHPQVNGVVRTYECLTQELEKLGHTVKVIGPADFPYTLPMPGYAEIRVPVFCRRKLYKMIADYQADSIHVATEGVLGWAARRWCLRHNMAFSTSYHTQFPDYIAKRIGTFLPFLTEATRKLGRSIIRRFHSPADIMFVATQSLEEQLRQWGFQTPIARLTRGVHFDQFYPGDAETLSTLPRPIALYVGRIAIEKNLTVFLDMPWRGSKVLVGDGPSMAALQTAYPQAVFVGRQSGAALADHYRSADVFVFPSLTDTFGMVLTEALACGLPVAAFNVTGPKDIITDPLLGVLADQSTGPNALSLAAEAAMGHGTKAARHAFVKNNYTWEVVAAQFLAAHNAIKPNTLKPAKGAKT